MSNLRPALFLDRDGVLIENRDGYVRSWDDVELFDQAREALALVKDSPYVVVVVTNQAGVGRGVMTLDHVESLNERILDAFRQQGAEILAAYLCPHHPDEQCECRKPNPGMLLQAAREHGLDLSRSYMVGDAVSDLEAGQAAGARGLMVRTGRGRAQEALLDSSAHPDWRVVDDLLSAVRLILSEGS